MNTDYKSNPFIWLLNNENIDRSISMAKKHVEKEKNSRLADIDTIFSLLLLGGADSGCYIHNLPLDVIAEIVDNGLSLEEKINIFQWLELKPPTAVNQIEFFHEEVSEDNDPSYGTPVKSLIDFNKSSILESLRKSIIGDTSDDDSSWGDI